MPPQNQPKTSLKETLVDERIKDITQKIQPARQDREQTSSLIQNTLIRQKENPYQQNQSPKKQVEVVIKPMRTYQGDIADAVKEKNESVTSISIAEKKRNDERGYVAPKINGDGGTGIVITLLSLILIGAGGFTTYVTFIKTKPQEQVIIVPKSTSLVSVSKESSITITGLQTTNLVSEIRKQSEILGVSVGSLGNIKLIKDDEKRIDPKEFFVLMGWRAPDIFIRSVKDFMIGVYGKELGTESFIIFKTNSFETAFPGMLSWEKNLPQDVLGLLNSTNGVFRDSFIKNRDVRIVQTNEEGGTLLYSFLDSKTVVITQSIEAFTAILNQFTTNQLVR